MHIQAFSPLCKECVVIVNPQLHSGPLHLNGDHYHKTYTEKKPNSLNNSYDLYQSRPMFLWDSYFFFKQTDILKKIKEKALIPNPLTLLDNATNNKWQRMH